MFIPDPDADFLPIPDLGVKKAPDPGSGSATLVYFDKVQTYIHFCKIIAEHMNSWGKYILKEVFNFLPQEHREPGKVGNKRWARRGGHQKIKDRYLWIRIGFNADPDLAF